MPKEKRKSSKNASDSVEQYARYVLEVIVVAVALLLLILLFFVLDEPQTAGAAGGGAAEVDSRLADYVRECSQGIPQACDKIAGAAENIEIPVREYDAERERLRQERIVW